MLKVFGILKKKEEVVGRKPETEAVAEVEIEAEVEAVRLCRRKNVLR